MKVLTNRYSAKIRWVVSSVVVMTVVVLGSIVSLPAATAAAPPKETLTAPFTSGPYGATSANEYNGQVLVRVTGTGQASGTAFSDAFYIYAVGTVDIVPPVLAHEFGLYMNGQPIATFETGGAVPAYKPNHRYTIIVNVSGPQHLTFGVGDTYTVDNTGSYHIVLRQLRH